RRPMQGLDLTRRFATIAFDDAEIAATSVVGGGGAAADAVDWQFRVAIAVQLAEMVGAMQRALDMTIEWSFDRYSFRRPLASYHELTPRFADMKLWLESSHAIADTAAHAVEDDAPDAWELLS